MPISYDTELSHDLHAIVETLASRSHNRFGTSGAVITLAANAVGAGAEVLRSFGVRHLPRVVTVARKARPTMLVGMTSATDAPRVDRTRDARRRDRAQYASPRRADG